MAPPSFRPCRAPSECPAMTSCHADRCLFACRGRDGGIGGAPPGRRPLLHRVLRAALPLHALFFLLLALACLVAPPNEGPSPSGCSLANNFARSFSPMLRYTNGPPPM